MGMDKLEDIKRAVTLSYELAAAPAHDVERMKVKAQVNVFLKELEAAPDGWRYGLELFLNTTSDFTRFYGLSRMISALERDDLFSCLAREDIDLLRSSVLGWVESRGAQLADEKPFVRNKVGVVLSHLVKREYPATWPDAFQRMLAFANASRSGAMLFLKVLEYITEEIVQLQSQRDAGERKQNTAIKDAMRLGALQQIVELWHQILVSCADTDPELTHACLAVMREYVAWIDINLVVNDKFVPVLYRFLTGTKVYRVHALKCFGDIVRKGMDHDSKVQLIRSLDLCATLQRECSKDPGATLAAEPGSPAAAKGDGGGPGVNGKESEAQDRVVGGGGDDDDDDDDDDGEDEDEGWGFRENVAALVSDIGHQLVEARHALPRQAPASATALEELSHSVIPLALFQCLASPDRDAQETILPFINKMIGVLREHDEARLGQYNNTVAARNASKRSHPPNPTDPELELVFRAALPEILPLLVRQMCYPANFTFDRADEEETEFEEHRKELRSVFVNISRVAAFDAVIPFLQGAVRQTLDPSQLTSRPPYQVEIAISLVYAFAEGAPAGVVVSTSKSMAQMAKLGNAYAKSTSGKKANAESPANVLGGTGVADAPNDVSKAAAEDERRAAARASLAELVASIHQCHLSTHPNGRVVLAYNELTARYVNFLRTHNPDLIGPVLQGMVGTGGIQHPEAVVRSQSCYLFFKVVKGLRSAIRPFAAELLHHLQDFLVVGHDAVLADIILKEMQEQQAEAALSGTNYVAAGAAQLQQPVYAVEDTMNLFEVASLLIGLDAGADPAVVNAQLERVMAPVHRKLEEIVQNAPSGPAAQLSEEQRRQRKLLGNWAAESIRALSVLTKGLQGQSHAHQAAGGLFKACLDTSLRALDTMPDHALLCSRIVTMLHCIVRFLGDGAIDFAPSIGVRLLEQSKGLERLLEAMQFINQLVTSLKAKLFVVLDQAFVRIVSHVANVLASVPDPFSSPSVVVASPAVTSRPLAGASATGLAGLGSLSAEQMEFRAVKRALLGFVLGLVENGLDPVLYSPANSPHLDQVLQILVDTLATFPDANAQRTACKALTEICIVWLDPEKSAGLDPNLRAAFVGLLLDKATRATFQATAVPGFVTSDFESLHLLEKICGLHQTLARMIGWQWLQALSETVLPSLSCPPALAREYATLAGDTSLSSKQLRDHFQRLFLSSASPTASSS